MELVQYTPQIWAIRNFLSPKSCEDLILLSEMRGFEEAEVSLPSGSRMMKGLRNNQRVLYSDPGLAERLWLLLQPFVPSSLDGATACGLNEQFRFYKYESEQRFKRHIDGRYRRNEGEESRITFMIYLNDDFTGGETAFDDAVVHPETGMALCFVHEVKHEGCPVTAGAKYALRSDVMYRKVEG